MTRSAAILRSSAALLLAGAAHLALLHWIGEGAEQTVQIQGGAVSFEIGTIAARPGAAPGGDPAPAEASDHREPSEATPPSQPDPEPLPAPAERAPSEVPREPVPETAPEPEPEAEREPEAVPVEPDPQPAPSAARESRAPVADAMPKGQADAREDGNDAPGAGAPASPGSAGESRAREPAADPGNAASANYAGDVMAHLSRVRRPRASGPGSAFVGFTIAPSGAVEHIAISQSSGSARFDRDALRVVERAAPFPVPSPGVNRSFVVEIEGR